MSVEETQKLTPHCLQKTEDNIVPVTCVTSVQTFWVQAPHAFGFHGVVGAYLDLILKERVGETLEEKLIDRHVKSWDDFLKTT